jgi:hypothetical protein
VDKAVIPFRAFIDHVPGLSLGEVQDRARRVLPARVEQSSLRWWSPGGALPEHARFLLVGVAVWSGYDMNLLDHLDSAVTAGIQSDTTVYVFDADWATSPEDFESLMPGISFVHHTPVVGYWTDGKLIETACGFQGQEFVARLFKIDEHLVHERITAAR